MALFERVVRSPLEFTFKDDQNGKYAQQVAKELEGKSNLLMDATYMPTNEDTRHRGRRESVYEPHIGDQCGGAVCMGGTRCGAG